jgi:DNA-binding XRE family transcriptional regulator
MKRRTSNRLHVLRAEQRLTQTEVAHKLGLATKFRYWQIENEQVEPTKAELRKLSRIFKATAEEMFPPKAAA